MRRKSFGLLIQCESYRMGEEWAITTILNHLHLLFLNFILEHTASVDYIISAKENKLWFLSQATGRQGLWLWVPSRILWFYFPSKCSLFNLYIFIWLIGSRKSARTHTAILCGTASQGQDKNGFFAGCLMSGPLCQLKTDGDFLLDSKEISSAQLHRKDEEPLQNVIALLPAKASTCCMKKSPAREAPARWKWSSMGGQNALNYWHLLFFQTSASLPPLQGSLLCLLWGDLVGLCAAVILIF